MIEQIIVILIVIAAAGYTVYRFSLKLKGASGGCGCSGCDSTACSDESRTMDCHGK